MSDEKKGMSLRRKKTNARPTISAPRQISPRARERSADSRWETQTIASTGTGNPVSREARPSVATGGDKTSDLVKRRYSHRFGNGATDGGFVPPVPAMPNLPAQYSRSRDESVSVSPTRIDRSPDRRGQGSLRVDRRALQDPNLQADKYVQSILADATENDIYAYQAELQNVKAHASADLQHNVYQNRTQFIKISNEADKLKTEMRTLRALMSDLTGALGHATSAGAAELSGLGGASNMPDRKRAHRSSIANLEALWTAQLQTLWKRVEGSQKYLPALPGRHVVMESQRWVELNAATWKPRRRVVLVMLNDHFLIACEKKRNDFASGQGSPNNRRQSVAPTSLSSQTVLVADRCWTLQDVALVDLSGPQTPNSSLGRPSKNDDPMKNALNIRAGNESFTYATSDTAEKAGLLVAFRKAQEDLRKRMAAEHGERERQMDELALLTGRDPRALKKAAAAATENAENANSASGQMNRSGSTILDVDGRTQSLRQIEAQFDGLDIDIALQKFEDAVSRVEKLRKLGRGIKGNAAIQEIILRKVDERAARTATAISRQLVHNASGAERTKANVHWLLRLGFEDLARSRYLDARTESIRLQTRQLPFTGALPPYLHTLAFVTFTMLVHTFRTFNSSFPAASGSAVVRWAKERVDEFTALAQRQLTSVEQGSTLWDECVQIIKEQASGLNEVGVDFTALVLKSLTKEAAPDTVGSTVQRRERRQAVGLGMTM